MEWVGADEMVFVGVAPAVEGHPGEELAVEGHLAWRRACCGGTPWKGACCGERLLGRDTLEGSVRVVTVVMVEVAAEEMVIVRMKTWEFAVAVALLCVTP